MTADDLDVNFAASQTDHTYMHVLLMAATLNNITEMIPLTSTDFDEDVNHIDQIGDVVEGVPNGLKFLINFIKTYP